jgi:hypothetical protein
MFVISARGVTLAIVEQHGQWLVSRADVDVMVVCLFRRVSRSKRENGHLYRPRAQEFMNTSW